MLVPVVMVLATRDTVFEMRLVRREGSIGSVSVLRRARFVED